MSKKKAHNTLAELFGSVFEDIPKGQHKGTVHLSPPSFTSPRVVPVPKSFPISIATALCRAASGFYKELADSLERWAMMQHEEARVVREYQMRAAQEELDRQMRAERQVKEAGEEDDGKETAT